MSMVTLPSALTRAPRIALSVSMVTSGLPRSGGDQRRHAAGGIAARPHLAAIGIPDAHEHVGLKRRLERDHLVAAHARVPVGDGRHLGGLKRKRARAGVEHDEVVAEPIHLAKSYGRVVGHFTETV